ncbi:hypothetical protein FHR24_003097 [Wenyingzhuangia heitensis]|uniref:Uncharacterized protein n=1 Tax=Wenyingzhuangia heitensis TaxID=1487859 RepID=A0ABX0UHW7_9FLAO|nr:hypothetical protein [Wenyingzhuangia heitensis]NIJ46607.1 hypothetical protein [Wenyingzhuangia heitensis]
MKNDKKLLEGIISDYYNSVEDLFFYRIKNDWKIDLSMFLFAISVFFLAINIIPILPGFNDDYFLFLFDFIKKNVNLPFEEFNFWRKWALGVIVSLITFVIFFIIFKYWENRNSKKAIRPRLIKFCYAFTLRKEIKSYLINENETHLENILDYFKKVIYSFTESPFYYRNSDFQKSISFKNLKKVLIKEYEWLEFTNETNEILNSLSSTESKLERRIKLKTELDKTLPLIDLIVLYEFSKIKPNESNCDGIEIKNQRVNYIKEFAKELNNIKEIDDVVEDTNIKRDIIKTITTPIINLFSSSNILTMFFSWLILLTILFVISSILVIKSLKLEIDSTILIGLLTAPFLGAITLVATIYTKNKK